MQDLSLKGNSLLLETGDPWAAVSVFSPLAQMVRRLYDTPAALLISQDRAHVFFPAASPELVQTIFAHIANQLRAGSPTQLEAPSDTIANPPPGVADTTEQVEHAAEPVAAEPQEQPGRLVDLQVAETPDPGLVVTSKKNEELAKLSKAINKLGPRKIFQSDGIRPPS